MAVAIAITIIFVCLTSVWFNIVAVLKQTEPRIQAALFYPKYDPKGKSDYYQNYIA